ncbi:MAG: EAL domain-containing protein [Gammaproteobacteria bacterium]|nr:EAL domain-containing protein [Gammaproteobacteria bacterium]
MRKFLARFGELRIQLPVMVGWLLVASTMIFAFHMASELQEDLGRIAAERSLTKAVVLADKVSVHVRQQDLTAISYFLDGAKLSSDAKEIAVFNEHGTLIYSSSSDSKIANHTPPKSFNPQVIHQLDNVDVWVPVTSTHLEGWLFINYRDQAAGFLGEAFIAHQIKDGLIVALIAVVVIVLIMRRPLKIINEASEFAAHIDDSRGNILHRNGGYSEIGKLVGSLNLVSKRLYDHEKSAENSNERLRRAQLVAGLGLWEWNTKTREYYWTDELYIIHCRENINIDVVIRSYLIKTVHPQDREYVYQAIMELMEMGESFSVDHRIILRDGVIRTVQHHVEATLNDEGEIVRLFGTVLDISDRKAVEHELNLKRKQVLNILESTTDGYIAIDNDFEIQYCNSKAREIFSITKDESVNKNLWDMIPELASSFYKPIYKAAMDRVPIEFEGYYPPENRWLEIHVYPHRTGVSVYFRDVTERRDAEEALRNSEEQVRTILDNVLDAIIAIDKNGLMITFNKAAEYIFGYKRNEVLGSPVQILMPDEYADKHHVFMNRYLLSGEARVIGSGRELVGKRKNNDLFPIEIELSAVHLGKEPIFIGIVRDLSVRRQTEQNMRLAEQVFSNSIEGIVILSPEKSIMRVNRSFVEISGYTPDIIVGKTMDFLFKSALNGQEMVNNIWKIVDHQGSWRGEFSSYKGEGGEYTAWATVSVTKDEKGFVSNYIMVCNDVTQMREAQDQIHRLANFDVLTELPNRTLLNEKLVQSIARSYQRGEKIALLRVDLDRFKTLNETLGQNAGDELLKSVAGRLTYNVRDIDVVSRLSGDEFSIMSPGIARSQDAEVIAKKVLSQFEQPFVIGDREVFITVSIGVAIYPDDAHDANDLMKHAGAAMHHVKEHGRNAYKFYSNDLDAMAFEQLVLENSLRRALERNEFVLFYQPQIDLKHGNVVGVEALIRWNHPDLGMVSPIRFIPLLEETGLILQVGEWVIQEACRQGKRWHEAGYMVRVAVNISPRQFVQGRQLAQVIRQAIVASGIDPQYLDLEITESSLMDNVDESVALLAEFKSNNIKISLDDFGTGYSSLSYLTRFPVDTLKIDRSFIRNALTDANDAALSTAIITMGRSLNIRVLAEGVETVEQLEFLRRQGCDEVQGFLFSKPVPAEEVISFFNRPLTEMTSNVAMH